jgi:hypothetical protein
VSSTSYDVSVPSNTAAATAAYDIGSGFADSFTRADAVTLGNGWVSGQGSMVIQGNRAVNPPTAGVHAATRPGLVGATQAVAASFASGAGNSAPEFGLLARYQNAGSYYTCYRRTGGASVLRIAKVVGGIETVLGSVGVANPAKGVSFKLGCLVQGSTLTLTLNGASKLVVSDPTFGTGSSGLSMSYRGTNTAPATLSWADDFTADML